MIKDPLVTLLHMEKAIKRLLHFISLANALRTIAVLLILNIIATILKNIFDLHRKTQT